MKTSYQGNVEKCAFARALNLPISTKVSYEIGNAIRGKSVEKVIAFLDRVMDQKEAVPFKRFNSDVGHKPGKIGPGRYPIKSVEYFKKLVLSAKANAIDKGLNDAALKVVHVAANTGVGQWRHGRQRRRQMKATHLEIAVAEGSVVKAKPKVAKKDALKVEAKKEDVKVDTKAESKPEVAKEEQKEDAPVKKEQSKSQESKPEETKQ